MDSSLSERRTRLPWEVFGELMRLGLRPLAQAATQAEAFWLGWRLVALDGTQFSLTNTPPIKATTRKAKSRRGRAAFAKLTTTILLELGLHNPLAAAIGRGGGPAGQPPSWRSAAQDQRPDAGGVPSRLEGRTLEARQGNPALAAQRASSQTGVERSVLLAGKIGRGLEGAAQDPRAKRRGQDGKVSQNALRHSLENLNVAGGKPVRIWVADEHRYGLIPVVRKCWTLRGVRPTAPYQTKYEWGYLYSALEVDGKNAAEFLMPAGGEPGMSGLFLEHLAASDPQAEHVVIWDQAGFHPDPELHAVPARIHLVPLPPYSPELNPVEAIGDVIKDRIANTLWKTLDDLEASHRRGTATHL